MTSSKQLAQRNKITQWCISAIVKNASYFRVVACCLLHLHRKKGRQARLQSDGVNFVFCACVCYKRKEFRISQTCHELALGTWNCGNKVVVNYKCCLSVPTNMQQQFSSEAFYGWLVRHHHSPKPLCLFPLSRSWWPLPQVMHWITAYSQPITGTPSLQGREG